MIECYVQPFRLLLSWVRLWTGALASTRHHCHFNTFFYWMLNVWCYKGFALFKNSTGLYWFVLNVMKMSTCVLMNLYLGFSVCTHYRRGAWAAGVWKNLIIPLIQHAKLFSCPCSSFLVDTHWTTWNSRHKDTLFSFQQAFLQCCRVILGQSQPHREPT